MRQGIADRLNEGIGEIEAVEKSLPFKKNKTKVVTLRVEEELYQLLQKQADKWDKPVAETFRNILSFYFLPILYVKKFKSLMEEKAGERFKEWYLTAPEEAFLDIKGAQLDKNEVLEYWKFLNEVGDTSSIASLFMRMEADSMLELAGELFKGSSKEINEELEGRKSMADYFKNVTQEERWKAEEEKEKYMKELKESEDI